LTHLHLRRETPRVGPEVFLPRFRLRHSTRRQRLRRRHFLPRPRLRERITRLLIRGLPRIAHVRPAQRHREHRRGVRSSKRRVQLIELVIRPRGIVDKIRF